MGHRLTADIERIQRTIYEKQSLLDEMDSDERYSSFALSLEREIEVLQQELH